MKPVSVALTYFLLFSIHAKAELVRNYESRIYSILNQTKKESLDAKKKRLLDLYQLIKKDFADSAYPESITENMEMSWKSEITIGIEMLQLKQFNQEKCESIRSHLNVQLSSPSVEKTEEITAANNLNDKKLPKDLIRDFSEYLCYE